MLSAKLQIKYAPRLQLQHEHQKAAKESTKVVVTPVSCQLAVFSYQLSVASCQTEKRAKPGKATCHTHTYMPSESDVVRGGGGNGKRHRQWKFLAEATAQVIQIAQIEIELTSCWLRQEK